MITRCGIPNKHKVRYPDRAAAEAKAHKRMSEVIGLALRVYPCPVCLGWHLTKMSEQALNARRAGPGEKEIAK